MQGASGDRDNGFSLPLSRRLVSQLTKILFRRIETKFCEPFYYLVRGEIRNNTANIDGGGIYTRYGGKISVYGGEVKENKSNWGGGIMVST